MSSSHTTWLLNSEKAQKGPPRSKYGEYQRDHLVLRRVFDDGIVSPNRHSVLPSEADLHREEGALAKGQGLYCDPGKLGRWI